MATTPVTNAVNNTAQQQAAQQTAAASSKPSAAITIQSNIKNSLFGSGSLSSSDVHVSSIQSNITNALKLDPKNANLLEAQKNMSTAAASSANAAAKAAALAAAQKSLQSALGLTTTKTTTPTTTTQKTTTPTTTTPTTTTTQKTTTPTTTTQKTTTTATTPSTTPKTTTATTPVVSTTSSPSSMVATTTPATTSTTSSAVGTYNPAVLLNVKNSLFGSGSLSTSNVHISSVNANIANALKVLPKDPYLLAAQKSMNSITTKTSASDKATALKSAQASLTSIYNASKSGGGGGGTVTPPVTPPVVPPVVPPVTPPVVTPVDSGKSIESNIRNSLFGKGSFETTALDYNTVNKNITNSLQLVSKVPAANIVGGTSQNQWQQVNSSLVSAQKNMAAALGNKGTDDAAGRARGASFIAAKTELTKAESLMNALGYKSGSGGVL